MKPSEQWKMFADGLDEEARELKERKPAGESSRVVAIALMGCAVQATRVQQALEKEEYKETMLALADLIERLSGDVAGAPAEDLAAIKDVIVKIRSDAVGEKTE